MKHHLGKDDFDASSSTGTITGHGCRLDSDEFMGKIGELFKEMDIRGDGEVSWDDFSAVRRGLGADHSITTGRCNILLRVVS